MLNTRRQEAPNLGSFSDDSRSTHQGASPLVHGAGSASQRSFASMEEKSLRRREAQTRRKRYREELDNMISDQLQQKQKMNSPATSFMPDFAIVDQVRRLTTQKIKALAAAPPLHYLRASGTAASSSVRIGDVVWNRPDPRMLYHVLRPDRRHANAVERGDGRTHLAVFFLEGVLLDVAKPSREKTGFQFSAIPAQSAKVVARIKQLHERGFRIILLDYLPSLHYGSTEHITRCLETVYRSVEQLVANVCTVTILLSIASNIGAAVGKSDRKGDDVSSNFAFPQPGMWQLFIQQLNHTLQPDRSKSFVVVSSTPKPAHSSAEEDESPCGKGSMLSAMQSEFAHRISLPALDCSSFLEQER